MELPRNEEICFDLNQVNNNSVKQRRRADCSEDVRESVQDIWSRA